MNPSRRPAGTPVGGQFAPTNRPKASCANLVDDDVATAARRVCTTVDTGIPSFSAEGLGRDPRETRDRVRAAMLSSGLAWPMGAITVVTTDPPERSADLDLEVALDLLKASGQLPVDADTDGLTGELGLDGSIRGSTTTDAPTLRALVDSLKPTRSGPTTSERCRSLGNYAVAISHIVDELGDDVPDRVTEAIEDAEELFEGIWDMLQAKKGAVKRDRDDRPVEPAPTAPTRQTATTEPATRAVPDPVGETTRTPEAEKSWRMFRETYGGWLDHYRKSLVIGGRSETERKLREAAGLAGVDERQLRADKSRAYKGETSEQILEGR